MSITLSGETTHDGDGDIRLLQWSLWCDIERYYEAPSRVCPGEDWSEVTKVYEGTFVVSSFLRGFDGGDEVVFHLYDLGSVMDFLELWNVDLDEALDNWEP